MFTGERWNLVAYILMSSYGVRYIVHFHFILCLSTIIWWGVTEQISSSYLEKTYSTVTLPTGCNLYIIQSLVVTALQTH